MVAIKSLLFVTLFSVISSTIAAPVAQGPPEAEPEEGLALGPPSPVVVAPSPGSSPAVAPVAPVTPEAPMVPEAPEAPEESGPEEDGYFWDFFGLFH